VAIRGCRAGPHPEGDALYCSESEVMMAAGPREIPGPFFCPVDPLGSTLLAADESGHLILGVLALLL